VGPFVQGGLSERYQTNQSVCSSRHPVKLLPLALASAAKHQAPDDQMELAVETVNAKRKGSSAVFDACAEAAQDRARPIESGA
jgi:hypothetical protein